MSIKLFKQAYATQIDLEPKAFLTELHMEAFLIENPDILSISDIGSNVEIIKNQIHIKDARKDNTGDGRLDMLIYIKGDKEEFLAVVELKKGELQNPHLLQLHDYLKSLNDPIKKNEIFEANSIDEKYLKSKLIGILIGSSIESNLKAKFLEGDTTVEGIKTFGMTLSRFVAKEINESYIISETFAENTSPFNRIRFETWDEYSEQQTKNGVTDKAIKIAKSVHDYLKDKLSLPDGYINYTNKDFSLNNPEGKRVKVFAYCSLNKYSLKVYFTYLGNNPNLEAVKRSTQPQRYPNQYFVDLKTDEDFTLEIKNLIEQSFYHILKKQLH